MHCWRMECRNAPGLPARISPIVVYSEHGVQSADAGGQFFGRTAGAGALDGFEGGADAVDGIANGVGEVAVEQQKFEDAVGGDVGGVDLAIGFECRAAAQKAHLLEVLVAGVLAFGSAEEIGLVDLEQGGGGVGALEVAAETDELPALAVNHGGIADAFEQVDAVDDGSEEVVHVGAELGLAPAGERIWWKRRLRRCHCSVEISSRTWRAFSRAAFDAEGDRGGIEAVEDEGVRPWTRGRRSTPGPSGSPSDESSRLQRVSALSAAGIEHQAHGHVELAHGVLGPLEVAAHPVEAVGNAAEHGRILPHTEC